MTTRLIKEGKAVGSRRSRGVERRQVAGRESLIVLTVADEVFESVKPYMSDARLAQLRDMATAVLDEDRTAGEGVIGLKEMQSRGTISAETYLRIGAF